MWAVKDFDAAEAWANEQRGAGHFGMVAKILSEVATKSGKVEAPRRWSETANASAPPPEASSETGNPAP